MLAMAMASYLFSARHLGPFLMAMSSYLFSAAICDCCGCCSRRHPQRMPASQPGGGARHRGAGRAKMPAGKHGVEGWVIM